MASAHNKMNEKAYPALAVTYEGDDPKLLERIVPIIDMVEIAPDAIAASDGKRAYLRESVLDEYAAVHGQIELIAHGVGLSIGSFDNWNEAYLDLIDELFDRFDLVWHSDHLAYTMVAGENVGTMLGLPRTEEVLDLVCERVRRVQERYPAPFLLEHIVHMLPDAPAECTPAAFLNEITSRTGCGLILDAYNLECDACNRGLDIRAYLDELNFSAVKELHLAGGVVQDGFHLDIHSGPVRASTLALGLDIIRRAPRLSVVTYEFLKEAIPLLGHDTVCAQLSCIRQAIHQ
jgi:uncharacterized protein (UPF0276 family)